MKTWRYLTTYLYLSLALLDLVFMSWAAWQRIRFPYDGLTWSLGSGDVQAVDSLGPAASQIQPGDRILAVDGSQLGEIFSLYQGKQPGDLVTLFTEHTGRTDLVQIRLTRPPWYEFPGRLMPALVSLFFWGIGLYVLAFKMTDAQSRLFFSTCVVGSAVLAAGSISAFSPEWVARLFSILLWWIIPLIIDFHLHFPLEIAPHRSAWKYLIYAFALAASLPYLFWDPTTLYQDSRYAIFYTVHRLWLAFGFIAMFVLLVNAYRRQSSLEARRRVRIVALGGGMALIPFSGLTLIPDALLRQPLLPYDVSLMFLLAIPLAYGYAIVHYHLIRLERYVSYAVASSIVVTLAALSYALLYILLTRLLPSELWQQPGVNIVIISLTALTFSFLYRRLQRIVNRLFYGGWHDYKSAVTGVSERLVPDSSMDTLARTLIEGIVGVMQLECACIFVFDSSDHPVATNIVCKTCRGGLVRNPEDTLPVLPFQKNNPHRSPKETEPLDFSTPAATPELACSRARLHFPLSVGDGVNSTLLLGPKRGGQEFTENDLEILDIVVRQANFALQNAYLISELEQQNQESVRLHQQILRSGEKERVWLAHELHDRVIQDLIGINYHLSKTRRELGIEGEISDFQDLQSTVQGIVREVRRICTELRPPALDGLGLVPAVRAHLRNKHSNKSYQILFQVEGNEEQDLPEEVSLCLFRMIQEAMANVQKHAQASQVTIWLRLLPHQVIAIIEDDGVGFSLPQRLGEFTNSGHFGLLGLQERVELVSGGMNIHTAPGHGCRIDIQIPL